MLLEGPLCQLENLIESVSVSYLCISVTIFSFILFLSRTGECDGRQRCFAYSLPPSLMVEESRQNNGVCPCCPLLLRAPSGFQSDKGLHSHCKFIEVTNYCTRGKTREISAYSPFHRCNHPTLMAAC